MKVGLVASSVLARPWSRPLTKCVFPAPRSPTSATTSLGSSDSAHSRAKAIVSVHAIGNERSHGRNAEARSRRRGSKMPMRVSGRRGNFLRHFSCSDAGVVRRKREKQFVIFAVVDRLRRSSSPACGAALSLQSRNRRRSPAPAAEIGPEPIAQVHHRVDRKSLRQPAGFCDSRDEIQMLRR